MKLIIKFKDDVDVHEALLGVQEVILLDKEVSESIGKKQHYSHASFKNGLHVLAVKQSRKTDTFVLYKELQDQIKETI